VPGSSRGRLEVATSFRPTDARCKIRELLQSGRSPTKTIAAEVSYGDIGSFRTVFPKIAASRPTSTVGNLMRAKLPSLSLSALDFRHLLNIEQRNGVRNHSL
jgi:hypothetical protein